jgi:hypothetical protein
MNYLFSETVNYDINIWILFVNDKLPCVRLQAPLQQYWQRNYENKKASYAGRLGEHLMKQKPWLSLMPLTRNRQKLSRER